MSSSKLNLVVNFQGQDGLSGTLKNIIGLGKSGGAALRELNQEQRKANRELQDYRKLMSGATGNLTELIDKETKLEKALADVNAQIDRQKRLSAIDASVGAMHNRADALQQKGMNNMIGGAALAAPFVLGAKKAAEFSSGMVDIQLKMGLTDKRTQQLSGTITTLAGKAAQLPEDMRAGFDMFASLGGMTEGQMTAALGPVGRLSTAFKVEIPDAVGAAHSSISNLKIPAEQTGLIFDMMATAGNRGAFEVKDMARHFPNLTSKLQALGQTGPAAVADLSSALQVAFKTTGNADQAANNISNLMSKINAPGTIKAFQKNFGVDLPAAMAKMEAQGYSSMEAIALITKQATGGDMKKLGFAFEDEQARGGVLALIQNMEEYRSIRDEAMKGSGTVDKAFETRMKNDPTVKFRELIGTTGTLAITLGTQLLPAINDAMGMLVSVGTATANWAKANPEVAGLLMKVAAGSIAAKIGFGALQFTFGGILKPMASVWGFFKKTEGVSKYATTLGKLKTGFAKVGPMFTKAGQWFGKLGPVLARGAGMAKTAFTVIRMGALTMARGIMQAGMMMLANPVVLAIVALVAVIGLAGYMIYKHWDTIKAAFYAGVAALGQAMAAAKAWVVNGWNAVKNGLMAGINFVIGLHSKMLNIGKNIILGLARGIISAAGAVWNALKSVVMSGINKVKDLLGIASPSRLFMQFGGWMGEGLAIGIDRSAKLPQKSMANLAGMMGKMGAEAMAQGGDPARFDPRRRVVGAMAAGAMALTPMAPASGAARAQMPSGATYYVTIKIDGAENKNARELAREIKRELEALDESDARSSFEDQE